MRVRSIRTRITLWYTSLLALTFLVLGAIACTLVALTVYEETDSALRSVAVALAEQTKSQTERLPPEVGEIFRRFFGPFPTEPYFEQLDPGGNLRGGPQDRAVIPLTPEAHHNAMAGIATFETLPSPGPYPVRVLTWPVADKGQVISVVRVGMSRVNLYRTTRRFFIMMAILLPFALALAGGGGWFFAHRALNPVNRMTETARRIGAGRLHERIELTGAGDELDRLADTLNNMLRRLDEAFTEMRQFTADASHELQTPLTILKGEIEVALRARRSEEEYTGILRSALEEVERIAALVEGLLLLARSDAGVLKLDRTTVDLTGLVEEVLGHMRTLAATRSVALKLGEIEPVEVPGDVNHLRRLLLNLVDNAVKYTPPGGTVKVSVTAREDRAIVAIADTGPGIPPDEEDKIFQRFYRSPEARATGRSGSGLGLSIVKSITEAHHGTIALETTPGKGSTFRVSLPLK